MIRGPRAGGLALAVALSCATLVCWLSLAESQAQPMGPVELVAPTGSALAERIRAELGAAGFGAVLIDGDESLASRRCRSPSEGDRRVRAVVALGSSASEFAAEICFSVRDAGAPASWQVPHPAVDQSDPDGVVAIEVVELLRSGLTDLGLDPPRRQPPAPIAAPAAPPSVSSPPVTARPEKESRVRPLPEATPAFVIDAGLGAAANLGATGPSPVAVLEPLWQPRRRLGLGLSLLIPVAPAHITSGAESSDVTVASLAAGVRTGFGAARGVWRLEAGAGGGLLWFQLRGTDVSGGHVAGTNNLFVGGFHAEVRSRWRLTSHLSLFSSLRAVEAVPKPVVLFAGRAVATVGRPLLVFALGLEYRADLIGFGD